MLPMGSESAMRSSTGATSRAAADAAANEIGALDERANQDLFDGRGEWSVGMAIEPECRQAGQVADRRKHARAGSSGETLELLEPLARITSARLVHRWQEPEQPRSVGLLEPLEQQRQREHRASLGALDGHQCPVRFAEVANSALAVHLRGCVD